MTLNRVNILSPNYSTRYATPRLIVLHTAEGATTYQSLGSYFSNPSSQVSSHVGIDDTPNTVGQYVYRQYSAWTQANANPSSVAAELCAFAEWTPSQWQQHPTMLENAAQWIVEESRANNIPITRLTPAQAQSTGRGVCHHVDLGAWGGNHWDCGPSFPIDSVIARAQLIALGDTTPPSPPSTLTEGIDMTSLVLGGQLHVWGIIGNNAYHWWQEIGPPSGPWHTESLPT